MPDNIENKDIQNNLENQPAVNIESSEQNDSVEILDYNKVIDILSQNKSFINEKYDLLNEYLSILNDNQNKVVKILIQHLESFLKHTKDYINEKEGCYKNYYIFPIVYLASIKNTEAFPLILDAFRVSTNNAYYLYEDLPQTDLSSIIVNTYNGDYRLLQEFIDTKKIDDTIRSQALMAFFKLGSDKKLHPNTFAYYVNNNIKKVESKANPSDNDIDKLTEIAVYISEFHIFSMLEKMRKITHSKAFDQSINGEYDNYVDKMFTYDGYGHITNIIEDYNFVNRAYFNRMYEFPKDYPINELPKISEKNRLRLIKKKQMMEDFINASRIVKPTFIGKNDLCFCGSGKKFKYCCMDKLDKHNDVYVCKRFEDYFDLLIDYPNDFKEEKKNEYMLHDEKGLAFVFCDKSIEMDKLFFKAIHNYKLPPYIPHDLKREGMEKASYLLSGLEIAYQLINENDIHDDEIFANKYMIHYNLTDCTNLAWQIIQDEHYPQPQFKQRIIDLIMLINKSFNE